MKRDSKRNKGKKTHIKLQIRVVQKENLHAVWTVFWFLGLKKKHRQKWSFSNKLIENRRTNKDRKYIFFWYTLQQKKIYLFIYLMQQQQPLNTIQCGM